MLDEGQTTKPSICAAEDAEAAGLRFVSDTEAGIGRRRRGKSVVYISPTCKPVKDQATLHRIAKLAIPTYHNRPAAPTNITLHQALDINVPIGCGDAPVFPGDVIVGDGEGVVVIPAHIADEIAAEAVEMTAFEDFVTEEVRKGRSIIGLYPATDAQTPGEFAAWRAKNKR